MSNNSDPLAKAMLEAAVEKHQSNVSIRVCRTMADVARKFLKDADDWASYWKFVADEISKMFNDEMLGRESLDAAKKVASLEADKAQAKQAYDNLHREAEKMANENAALVLALFPVAEEIRNTGNEYKESDWNPDAHIEKPVTLTIREARRILAALSGQPSQGWSERKALENCRLLAAREFHKTKDPLWEHILRFCKEAGVEGSLLREPSHGKEPERCTHCNWPMAKEAKDGCVPGNCSMRPVPKPNPRQLEREALTEARNFVHVFRHGHNNSWGEACGKLQKALNALDSSGEGKDSHEA
jgi:hypothetical protein